MQVALVYGLACAVWAMVQLQTTMVDPKSLVPAEEFLQLDGLDLHYLHAGLGKGSPVVLLHGFGGWTRDWRATLPALAEDHEVFALDLPGWGLSAKPPDLNYSLEAQARLVLDFLDHFGLQQVDLVGNSMGGGISIYIATEHPERVRKLVLIDSVGYEGFTVWQRIVHVAAHVPGASQLVQVFLPIFPHFRYQTRWLFGDADKTSLEAYQDHYLPLRTPGAAGALVRMVKTLHLDSVRSRIPGVRQPTLILWGKKDPFMPVGHVELFARDIPHAQIVVFPEASHVPQAEVPEQVNPLLAEFLK